VEEDTRVLKKLVVIALNVISSTLCQVVVMIDWL